MFSSGAGDRREACQLESSAESTREKCVFTPIKKRLGSIIWIILSSTMGKQLAQDA